jgi:hypothetical protein
MRDGNISCLTLTEQRQRGISHGIFLFLFYYLWQRELSLLLLQIFIPSLASVSLQYFSFFFLTLVPTIHLAGTADKRPRGLLVSLLG